jgi:hypothetical protein
MSLPLKEFFVCLNKIKGKNTNKKEKGVLANNQE